MALLTLKTLDCIKKQDVFSDKVTVFVDGTKVTGDIKIDKNDPPFLIGFKGKFTGRVPITLTEVDKNGADEILGTVTADAAKPGVHTGIFNDDPKFDYRLTYEASA